ncbi:Sodium-dependent transporter, SNF family [hydrothermal vent metagenome]|uniref:Sodium-dependent transporter, SNF family n=1 Tax=hydrothermal vent metagenome TaxID=652676 RepID=A0A3B0S733_9ZZZZ
MAGSVSQDQWSSRFAFLMAAVGSSVGLGNLWRFSAEAGQNGGGAFIMIYLLCVLLIGIPVLMSEYIIGRAGNANSAIRSVTDIADRSGSSRQWSLLGWIGMIASFLIVSFYCVVAAWVIIYIPKFLFGAFDGQTVVQISEQFAETQKNIWGLSPTNLGVMWAFSAFAALTTWLVARGVNQGIEWAAKVLMPLFFFLLFSLSLYSMWSGFTTPVALADGTSSNGAVQALKFLFAPDFAKVTPEVITRALGQAFFSIGLGSAIMITYGSYLPRSINIPRSAIVVGLTDTAVALIAGLAIFPIVFSHGLNVNSGAGLFFETLPIALSSAPGGKFIGAGFFFLAIFAAVTSSISLLEPFVAWVIEKFQITRKKAAIIMGSIMWVLGLGSIFIGGFMGVLDGKLTGAIMLPLTGLLTVLFVGWKMKKSMVDEEMAGASPLLRSTLFALVRYVAPVFVFVVLVLGIDNTYFGGFLGKMLGMA